MLRDDVRLDVLLDKLIEVGSRISRLETARTDDANFEESKHPRDADGKFTKSFSSGAVDSYTKTLKPGKKGTASGLIKHLLLGGKHSSKDIFGLAKEFYGAGSGGNVNGKAYVNYYVNELKKAGHKVPPLPEKSEGGGEKAGETPVKKIKTPFGTFPESSNSNQEFLLSIALEKNTPVENKISDIKYELNKSYNESNAEYGKELIDVLAKGSSTLTEEKPAAAAEPSPEAKAEPTAPVNPNSPVGIIQFLAKNYKDVPKSVAAELKALEDNWDKILPDNQKSLAMGLANLRSAVVSSNKKALLGILKPLSGGGMAKDSYNKILQATKDLHGVSNTSPSSPTSGYTPTTDAEKKVYEAAKSVAHYRIESTAFLEDSSGKEVKSVQHIDTKKIPENFYASVSSAYGSSPGNGNTHAVDGAMEDYRKHIWGKLTPEQQSAMSNYKGSGYALINEVMLGKSAPNKYTLDKIARISEAIDSSVVPADTPVFRGLRSTLKSLSGFDDPEHSVGRCFEHKNFASVSRSEKIARGFGERTLLKLTLPAGSKGFALGGQDVEREIVLPARSIFRIDKVEKVENMSDRHIVHVTYMGERKDDA
jgi:hypothetical protein